ncbi:hypothetical protein VYU27_009725, partial [Nannochloropsis oceanica]
MVASWMESAGLPLNKVAFTTLLKACAQAKQGFRALEVLQRLHASDIYFDYLGYLKAVEILGASGLVHEALSELEGMLEEEVAADHRIFFSLIRNALLHNHLPVAARTAVLMDTEGCTPPASSLKLLMESLIKAGLAARGLELLDTVGPASFS